MSMNQRVAEHYTHGDLAAAIRAALAKAGKDLERLTVEDLAPVDEFHVRGREATLELGRALGLAPGLRVLDVGSGIGGASRHLASTFGCRVSGVDLTEEYCRVATTLADWVGLADRVDYRQGDALAMPFEDDIFDTAVTQHVAMNIEDKAALYREVARVLRPGGAFGIYDFLKGPGGEVLYPTPWAGDASTSFLATPEEMRTLLAGAGFDVGSWRDTSAEGRAFLEAAFARIAESGPPALGLHVLMPGFRPRAENMLRNLREERVVLAEVVCRKVRG